MLSVSDIVNTLYVYVFIFINLFNYIIRYYIFIISYTLSLWMQNIQGVVLLE